MKKSPINPKLPGRYKKMSAAELEKETATFDEEFVSDRSRPLSATQRKRLATVKQRGRPKVGDGAEKIRISVERSLLQRADAYAAKQKVSRSQLIADALTAMIRSKAG